MTILSENVQELLDQGVIKPSTSAYDSPAFLVPKPGGEKSAGYWLSKIKSKYRDESVPLPDLHSAFDWFSEARYFTIFTKIPPTTRYPVSYTHLDVYKRQDYEPAVKKPKYLSIIW